jgi:rubrerythrin
MSDQELREVFRRIASGEEEHGDFLTLFAKALQHANFENYHLMRPTALVLARKYHLFPGLDQMCPTSAAMEQQAVYLAMTLKARAVLMVILHQDSPAEVVVGIREEIDDLGGLLQKLAHQVKDGDGMPIGRNGRIINQT